MSINLIGNRSIFAIEYSHLEKSPERIEIKVWIGGFAIGRPFDDDYSFIPIDAIRGILELEEVDEFNITDERLIFDTLLANELKDEGYTHELVFLGESFDEYLVRAYLNDENQYTILAWFYKPNLSANEKKVVIKSNMSKEYLNNVFIEFKTRVEGYKS